MSFETDVADIGSAIDRRDAEIIDQEQAIGKLQDALGRADAKRSELVARVRELCALMQHDLDGGKITLTPTRKMVLEQARRAAALYC